MTDADGFTGAVAACLAYGTDVDPRSLEDAVRLVLGDAPQAPSRAMLEELHWRVTERLRSAGLPEEAQRVALVYGGATKIKGYVFEAPKLPEIRGASALLEWVNDHRLPAIWRDTLGASLGKSCIIYTGGGSFLAFAPAAKGAELAGRIEQEFTRQTLTANSVAVAETFSLIELRYGRQPLDFWTAEFLECWRDPQLRAELEAYYYAPMPGSAVARLSDGEIREAVPGRTLNNDDIAAVRRFLNRKQFGELVTLLATMFNRRRDERAYAGAPRTLPLYPMLPWAEKCDSSDVRPAEWSGTVAGETRAYSEPSARKRYVGQLIKRDDDDQTRWYTSTFAWRAPADLRDRSWETQWETFLNQNGTNTPYRRAMDQQQRVAPPRDLNEIGAASRPDRYIGIIYADGNNVGRLIATLSTPDALHQTSQYLSDAATNAVFTALAHCLRPAAVRHERQRVGVHPFEILTIGGDDLLLIVPGNRAFDVALMIAYEFERSLAEHLLAPSGAQASNDMRKHMRYARETPMTLKPYTPSIGLSAGVVIAHESAPIFFLRDLVEELLKRAKKLAHRYARQHYYGGAVDFMALKSVTMVADTVEAFRKAALHDESDRRLTARPYTWHEFAGLLETARALKRANFPRSQLYRLRRVMETTPGVIASSMEYLYTRVRQKALSDTLSEYIEQQAWQSADKALRRPVAPPWLPVAHQAYETIWPDLAEIYDMVPAAVEEEG
ncbi:MAG: type III-B CRISPR-associated protein Cas10/Cmr2 [Roseiflexaceae bacterium]|nr:type III-B CRISPR-associated protein Cas10/Cmr2 [Roseiflexaceae bacterium]